MRILHGDVNLGMKVFFPTQQGFGSLVLAHPSWPGVCTQPERGISDEGAGPSSVTSSSVVASYSAQFVCFLLNP